MTDRTLLFVLGRNFGDAVIATGLIEAMGRSVTDTRISVLTRPEFREVFDFSPYVTRIHLANFPMGTVKHFDALAAWNLALKVIALRRDAPEVINFTGDFRENLLGWLINPISNYGIEWEVGHPYRRLVRQGLRRVLTRATKLGLETVNVYAAMQLFAGSLGASEPARPRLYDSNRNVLMHQAVGNAIGFHVSASQNCKIWPAENWRRLLQICRSSGFEVKVFGAPAERPRIAADLAEVMEPGVEIVTGSVQEFLRTFSQMRAVVCLDSFSVHAAYALGIPTVMINGANMSAIWQPPGTCVIDGGVGLPCAPCMNEPTCLASGRPYRCIRDISVDRVWSALLSSGLRVAAPRTTLDVINH